MIRNIFFLLFLFALSAGCDDCDDCEACQAPDVDYYPEQCEGADTWRAWCLFDLCPGKVWAAHLCDGLDYEQAENACADECRSLADISALCADPWCVRWTEAAQRCAQGWADIAQYADSSHWCDQAHVDRECSMMLDLTVDACP